MKSLKAFITFWSYGSDSAKNVDWLEPFPEVLNNATVAIVPTTATEAKTFFVVCLILQGLNLFLKCVQRYVCSLFYF